MPVGLFMNTQLETLHHSTPGNSDSAVAMQQQMNQHHMSPDVHQANNNQVFDYLTKLGEQQKNTNSAILIDSNDSKDLFNEFMINRKIDTILMSPMSIPIDSNTSNTSNTTTTPNFFINSISNNNLFESTSNNLNNNENLIGNQNFSVQDSISKQTSSLIEMNSNNNNNENFNNYLQEQESLDQTCQINELTVASQPDAAPRNTIDFAIDAVLEKCRMDSGSDDEIFEVVLSKNSQKIIKTLPVPTPQPEQQQLLLPVQTQTPIITQSHTTKTDNLLNSINAALNSPQSVGSAVVKGPVTGPIQATSPGIHAPMSKSSKARTSYISSLIANRQKPSAQEAESTVIASQKSSQSQTTEDEKQKRISQNILTILANNSQQQQVQNQVGFIHIQTII